MKDYVKTDVLGYDLTIIQGEVIEHNQDGFFDEKSCTIKINNSLNETDKFVTLLDLSLQLARESFRESDFPNGSVSNQFIVRAIKYIASLLIEAGFVPGADIEELKKTFKLINIH